MTIFDKKKTKQNEPLKISPSKRASYLIRNNQSRFAALARRPFMLNV